jgi:hypothetical protein
MVAAASGDVALAAEYAFASCMGILLELAGLNDWLFAPERTNRANTVSGSHFIEQIRGSEKLQPFSSLDGIEP